MYLAYPCCRYTTWGGRLPHRPVKDLAFAVARFFQRGGSFQNYYMYFGGTNFGRTSGGPNYITSYDYDAPLDEYGLIRQPKWGHLKDLHDAIKLCEPALVAVDSAQYLKLGPMQEAHMYSGNAHNEGQSLTLTGNASRCSAFLANIDEHEPATVKFLGHNYTLPPCFLDVDQSFDLVLLFCGNLPGVSTPASPNSSHVYNEGWRFARWFPACPQSPVAGFFASGSHAPVEEICPLTRRQVEACGCSDQCQLLPPTSLRLFLPVSSGAFLFCELLKAVFILRSSVRGGEREAGRRNNNRGDRGGGDRGGNNGGTSEIVYYYCKEPGHTKRYCKQLHNHNQRAQTTTVTVAATSSSSSEKTVTISVDEHAKLSQRQESVKETSPVAVESSKKCPISSNKLVVDSGATDHMTVLMLSNQDVDCLGEHAIVPSAPVKPPIVQVYSWRPKHYDTCRAPAPLLSDPPPNDLDLPIGLGKGDDCTGITYLKKFLVIKFHTEDLVSIVSQFMSEPIVKHWAALKQILCYWKGAPGLGLLYSNHGHSCIECFSDADWAGSKLDRKSTTGYCVFVGGNLVSLKSKKQSVVSRSSVESEYRPMA
ncbi:hypothetical protein RJ639_016355 [Escallonia herrerae]|uniref:beta-galactosidase n=1 Tax=Escallonia herrerae TaxID=1293975 RepID=A0AA88VBK0_9ASTE|nr:hypothetical protein RJ639_016355 [Escallonia herrerae]